MKKILLMIGKDHILEKETKIFHEQMFQMVKNF